LTQNCDSSREKVPPGVKRKQPKEKKTCPRIF